jgi:DUF4097 and DUF4098 domain-containing protein YvlB
MAIRVLALLIIATATVSALTEDNVNQQLNVKPGGKIIIDVDFGSIDVSAGADDKAIIEAHRQIESNNKAQEEEYLSSAPIIITNDGNTVTIHARRNNKDHIQNWSGHSKRDARYTVHVPKKFNSELRSGGGSISCAELNGTMNAETNGGKLKFTHLHGSTSAVTNGGSIDLIGCEGPVKVETNGGAIQSTDGNGSLEARTSGGSIGVKNFGGNTSVETSGGGLSFENVNGKIEGRTSGGSITAQLRSPIPGDIELETSAGGIEVLVPPNAGLDVEAETSAGHVTTELPFSGDRSGRDHLKGKINGGGKSLVLRSGAGSISIKPASKEVAVR